VRVGRVDHVVALDDQASRARSTSPDTKASSASRTMLLRRSAMANSATYLASTEALVSSSTAFADVHRQVADALEIGDQLVRDGDEAQVPDANRLGGRAKMRSTSRRDSISSRLSSGGSACTRGLGQLVVGVTNAFMLLAIISSTLGAHSLKTARALAQLGFVLFCRCARRPSEPSVM